MRKKEIPRFREFFIGSMPLPDPFTIENKSERVIAGEAFNFVNKITELQKALRAYEQGDPTVLKNFFKHNRKAHGERKLRRKR